MDNFTSLLTDTKVAFSPYGIRTNNTYENIPFLDVLTKLKTAEKGDKDGSHILRTELLTDEHGLCLSRSNKNTQITAQILIIDCDQRIDISGEVVDGAPDPEKVSESLRKNNIVHILYGSYSHYEGSKGNRYRILIPTALPYTEYQISSTLELIIAKININLEGVLLVNAKENSTWSQPWYLPRKPINSNADTLWFEYMGGNAIEPHEPIELPPISKFNLSSFNTSQDEISPIQAYNDQHPITDLLSKYNYKKIYAKDDLQKWLSPDSTSNAPGITVKNNKIYSHHNNKLNDGYWHDSFDLMRASEGLSKSEAVKKAAQYSLAPDGRTVDEYNKSLAHNKHNNDAATPSHPIPHAEILDRLIEKVMPISFRKVANITDEKTKLKAQHFYVIVIETVLHLAKKYNWCLCRNHDFIYVYNGEYWNLIDEDDIKTFLGNAAEKMTVDKYSARYFGFRDQLFKQFLALAHLPKPTQPKDVTFINLKNGTFEISPNGTRLKDFDYNDFITYQLSFEYKPDAKCELFQIYLDRVLPDKALQCILSEYLGYVFIRTSTLKLEKALLLYGKGANGKSVFYEIVRNLFGEQNTSEYSLQALTDDTGYQRAMIANKLVNYASEINGRLEAATFKQLVSGESVEARLPYGNPFIMSDYAKLIFNCNDLPKDVEQTEAYFRRFLIIPFDITIPEHEQDKQLAKKIIDTELSGIFNWVLEGLKRLLIKKQFTDSEIVRHARIQYEKESDSVKLFLEETEYRASISNFISIKTLYQEYRLFCLDNGHRPVNNVNFRKRLENANIIIERKNCGNVAFVGKYNEYSHASDGE